MKVPLIVQERFCRQSAALMKAGFNLSDVFAYLQVSLPKHTAIQLRARIWHRFFSNNCSWLRFMVT